MFLGNGGQFNAEWFSKQFKARLSWFEEPTVAGDELEHLGRLVYHRERARKRTWNL